MRIITTELLLPTAEEIRNLVKMAYDTGCARGREEAKRELRGLVESIYGAAFEARDTAMRVANINRVDQSSLAGDVKRLRRDLAELKEMERLGAGIPGDTQRIEMIKGLLALWHKIVPVIIFDAAESHLQTRH